MVCSFTLEIRTLKLSLNCDRESKEGSNLAKCIGHVFLGSFKSCSLLNLNLSTQSSQIKLYFMDLETFLSCVYKLLWSLTYIKLQINFRTLHICSDCSDILGPPPFNPSSS